MSIYRHKSTDIDTRWLHLDTLTRIKPTSSANPLRITIINRDNALF